MQPITVDFETEVIANWPDYPPKPVGVSIWHPEAEKPLYLAWGHPSENNSTYENARATLAGFWNRGPVLFHHARFDTEVARVHMGLPYPENHLDVHDTLFLNYLYDIHAQSLSLKPSAHRILGIPPDEKDELDKWLIAHGFKPGRDICMAPGDLVGAYANGDTYRTRRLFDHLYEHTDKNGMLAAYRREQWLAPILSQSESDGCRIDVETLYKDLVAYEKVFSQANDLVYAQIGGCNLDSSAEMAKALLSSGLAQESDFLRTPTGKLSTSKASMDQVVKDPALRSLMSYRGHLKTLLTTFMRPWAGFASHDGYIRPHWNQVKGDEYGTRTGRLSSSDPNFQNIPTELKGNVPDGLPPLPFMRKYILPDEGYVLAALDFNGQEMRIASHFSEGRAAEIYRTDPSADFHKVVAGIIKELSGLDLPHKIVKNTGFGLLYGSGDQTLSETIGTDIGTARKIGKAYFAALPDFEALMNDVSSRGAQDLPVKTWGGRLIHREPSKMVKSKRTGKMYLAHFEYKLTNYLIQGSAADQTKEALVRCGYRNANRRFMITVHDENVFSINPEHLDKEVAEVRSSMEDQEGWDVPFKAKVEIGPNWHNMVAYAPGAVSG